MENKKIALFDMDDTLCDYVNSMLEELEKLRAPDESSIDPFKIGRNPEYKYLQNRMHLIKADENWWANLPRYQLGFDIFKMTNELGYFNEILTQAPINNPAALAGKLKWILNNFEETPEFTMTRNKSRHYGRVLVDDYPDYAISWLNHRKNGLVIMPTNEYNREFEYKQVLKYDGSNKQEIRKALIEYLNK